MVTRDYLYKVENVSLKFEDIDEYNRGVHRFMKWAYKTRWYNTIIWWDKFISKYIKSKSYNKDTNEWNCHNF